MKKTLVALGLTAASTLCFASSALADPVTVYGYSDIYAAGSQSTFAGGAGSDSGAVPPGVSIAAGGYFTFNVTGSVVLNEYTGGNVNDPDGANSQNDSS